MKRCPKCGAFAELHYTNLCEFCFKKALGLKITKKDSKNRKWK